MSKRWQVLTIFPEMFVPFTTLGVTRRAFAQIDFSAHQLRDWCEGENLDDRPFGGGPGMVMRFEPVFRAVKALTKNTHVVLTSPQGKVFTQADAKRLAAQEDVLFICGRYEGVDERVMSLVDEEISIGDMVLTGGELPAMVMMDAMSRYLPGVVGNADSVVEDSFTQLRLDHPHYTRPADENVPNVLLSGDHAKIAAWRSGARAARTQARRPDLLAKQPLSRQEQEDLALYFEETV